MDRYQYTDHQQIPAEIRDFLMSIVDAHSLGDVSIESINGFLNGYEDWIDEQPAD